jgi:hypothetical protein
MKIPLTKLYLPVFLTLFLCGSAVAEVCTEPGAITRVTNRSRGNFEYVIFDIKKSEEGGVPEYEVRTSNPPFTDYSGEETYKIGGSKFKTVVFRSIMWMCEIPEQYRLPKTAVKGIKLLSSFEGIVEFAVGYRSRSRYLMTYAYDAGSVTKVVMKFRK